jgi:hypothetical protein
VNLADGANAGFQASYSGTTSQTLAVLASTGYPSGLSYRALATNASGATAATGPVSMMTSSVPTASVHTAPAGTPLSIGAPL